MSSLTPIEKHKSCTGLVEFYQKLLEPHGVSDKIKNVILKDPELKGEGAGSDRRFVTVEFENDSLKPLYFFVKMQITENPEHLALTREMKSFEKECVFFTKYLPAAKHFCTKLKTTLHEDIYPKCFYGDENIFIMENLRVGNDYQVLGKEEKHDMETARFALKTLATHHAIGYVLIKDVGGPENFFEQFPSLDYQGVCKHGYATIVGQWMEAAMDTNVKILETSSMENASEALLILKDIRNRAPVMELCAKTLETEQEELLLLTHGDYWYGNMLFLKDPVTAKVIQEKALDFAQTLYNSPATDLAYYMLTSVQTGIRQKHLSNLLQYYLSNFSKFCAELGHPVDLSYETLFAQYRKKLDFGLMIAFISRYSPGEDMFKDADLSKVGSEWGSTVAKLGDKWIAENPEKAECLAKEIISVMMEYKDLTSS